MPRSQVSHACSPIHPGCIQAECPVQVNHFVSFIPYFCCSFCKFRCTNTYHVLQLPTVLSTGTCRPYRLVAQDPWAVPQPRWAVGGSPGVCTCVPLWCLCSNESPSYACLRTCVLLKQYMTVFGDFLVTMLLMSSLIPLWLENTFYRYMISGFLKFVEVCFMASDTDICSMHPSEERVLSLLGQALCKHWWDAVIDCAELSCVLADFLSSSISCWEWCWSLQE